MLNLIKPNWPAPKNIRAFSTTRDGGVSEQPYHSLNLGMHVGDDHSSVAKNRQHLQSHSSHPSSINWLEQVHSNVVVEHRVDTLGSQADAIYSYKKDKVCLVMTADCLPVLFCSKSGDFVAAAHAGWVGLANGVLLNTVKQYSQIDNLLAWIGPAISRDFFEVGEDVRNHYLNKNNGYEPYFKPIKSDKYLVDLPAMAELQLRQLGVDVYQSELCTYNNKEQFFSYRRDGVTGRMATMIWIDNNNEQKG